MRASSCIHVYTYTPIHVYMYSRPHEYILKEEGQDIIIRLEGRENEGWCCEPVPFSTNGHAVVSNWLSGNRLRPTYSVYKQPHVVSWAPSETAWSWCMKEKLFTMYQEKRRRIWRLQICWRSLKKSAAANLRMTGWCCRREYFENEIIVENRNEVLRLM